MPRAKHIHSWQVDSPDGPTSTGRCACGAEREFVNSHFEKKLSPNEWNQLKSGPVRPEEHKARMQELADAERYGGYEGAPKRRIN